jgi:integrase
MPLGKARGRMLPFTEAQIAGIRANLSRPDRPPRDLAIFECWLHTLLRVSDFRELMVADVLGQHGIRDRIVMRQRKVSTAKRCQPVEVGLPPKAREALAAMIEVEGKRPNDFLFTARNRHREPLCRKQLSNLVKAWAREIGMDTHRIAAHSMRRTRPTIAIRRGTASLVNVQHWLGHKQYSTSVGYIGIEHEDSMKVSEDNAM